jgi:hypothetical protein
VSCVLVAAACIYQAFMWCRTCTCYMTITHCQRCTWHRRCMQFLFFKPSSSELLTTHYARCCSIATLLCSAGSLMLIVQVASAMRSQVQTALLHTTALLLAGKCCICRFTQIQERTRSKSKSSCTLAYTHIRHAHTYIAVVAVVLAVQRCHTVH